jgi:IS30 family transposase
MPAVRMMLTLPDREEISRGLAQGLPYNEIAVLLGRDPSIISREVRRRGGRGGYRAVAAAIAAAVGAGTSEAVRPRALSAAAHRGG